MVGAYQVAHALVLSLWAWWWWLILQWIQLLLDWLIWRLLQGSWWKRSDANHCIRIRNGLNSTRHGVSVDALGRQLCFATTVLVGWPSTELIGYLRQC